MTYGWIKVKLEARVRIVLTGYGAEILNKAREEIAGNLKAGDVVGGLLSDLFYYFGPLMAGDGFDGRAWAEDSFWVNGHETGTVPGAMYGFLGGVVEAIQAPNASTAHPLERDDEDVLFTPRKG